MLQEQIYIDRNHKYLKGNLHTHTDLSDGKYPLTDVLKFYSENGYDFIGITDHDLYYESETDCSELVILAGQEVTCDYVGNAECKGAYVHFSCFQKLNSAIAPLKYHNAAELQECIDVLKKNYRLVQFNHPMFSAMFAKLTDNDILSLKGYHLLEVYNQKDFLNETGISSSEVLVRTLLNHKKRVFLSAGDDFHGPYKKTAVDYFGGGYVMVHAEKNENDILSAIEKGEFYATTGPKIYDFRRIGDRLEIQTSPAKNIIFYSNVRRCKNLYSENGDEITCGEYVIRDDDYYIWAKIVGSDGKTAWTQPIYL